MGVGRIVTISGYQRGNGSDCRACAGESGTYGGQSGGQSGDAKDQRRTCLVWISQIAGFCVAETIWRA